MVIGQQAVDELWKSAAGSLSGARLRNRRGRSYPLTLRAAGLIPQTCEVFRAKYRQGRMDSTATKV